MDKYKKAHHVWLFLSGLQTDSTSNLQTLLSIRFEKEIEAELRKAFKAAYPRRKVYDPERLPENARLEVQARMSKKAFRWWKMKMHQRRSLNEWLNEKSADVVAGDWREYVGEAGVIGVCESFLFAHKVKHPLRYARNAFLPQEWVLMTNEIDYRVDEINLVETPNGYAATYTLVSTAPEWVVDALSRQTPVSEMDGFFSLCAKRGVNPEVYGWKR